MAAAGTVQPQPQTVPPVFVLDKALPGADQKEYTVVELCSAAEKVTGFGKVVGSQRIHNLHRIYFKDLSARTAVLVNGLVLRGTLVQVRDQNPNIVRQSDGTETELRAVRLTIGNVPLSVSNEDILQHVQTLPGVTIRSRLMDERARDENNKLTSWLTGRRFIYINAPSQPLPRTLKIGIFSASLYHPGQKITKCSNCLELGHHVSACRSEVKCRHCFKVGHKQGDPECELTLPAHTESSQTTPPPDADGGKEQEHETEVTLPRIVESKQQRERRSRSAAPVKRQRSPASPSSLSPSSTPKKKASDEAEEEKEEGKNEEEMEEADKNT